MEASAARCTGTLNLTGLAAKNRKLYSYNLSYIVETEMASCFQEGRFPYIVLLYLFYRLETFGRTIHGMI